MENSGMLQETNKIEHLKPPISRLLDNHEIFAEKKQNLLLLTDHL